MSKKTKNTDKICLNDRNKGEKNKLSRNLKINLNFLKQFCTLTNPNRFIYFQIP